MAEGLGGELLGGLKATLGLDISDLKKKAGEAKGEFTGLSGIGKAAFVGLAVASAAFVGVAIKNAIEGEKAHAQLVQAVNNVGGSMKSLDARLESSTPKFEKLGFVNDEVEGAMTKLVQITGNQDAALGDLNLTMDIARARHMGLSEAAGLVGKVSEGNTRALKSLIGTTTDASGVTYTAAGAMAELQKRFGGAAQADANTFAGKLRALKAEGSDLAEKFGMALLPALTKVLGVTTDSISFVARHQDVAKALAVVIGFALTPALYGYAAAQAETIAGGAVKYFETLSLGLQSAAGGFLAAAEAEGVFGAALDVLMGPVGWIAGALSLGVAALHLFGSAHHENKTEVDSFRKAIEQDSGAIGDNTKELIANTLQGDKFLSAMKKSNVGIDEQNNLIKLAQGALQGHKKAFDDEISSQIKSITAQRDATVAGTAQFNALQKQRDGLKDYKKQVDDSASSVKSASEKDKEATQVKDALGGATDGLTDSTSSLTQAQKDEAKQSSDAKNALKELMDYINGTTNSSLDLLKATNAEKDGLAELGVKLKAAKGDTTGNTQASRDLTDAFADQIQKIEDVSNAKANANKIGHDSASILADEKAQLDELAKKYPALKGLIDEYASSLAGAANAQGNLNAASGGFNGVKIGSGGQHNVLRANSGPLMPNTSYITGEAGRPEVIEMGASAGYGNVRQLKPNEKSGGSESPSKTIQMNVYTSQLNVNSELQKLEMLYGKRAS